MSIYGIAIRLMFRKPEMDDLPEFNREILKGFSEGKSEYRAEIVQKLNEVLYTDGLPELSYETATALLLVIAREFHDSGGAYKVIDDWLKHPSNPHAALKHYVQVLFTTIPSYQPE